MARVTIAGLQREIESLKTRLALSQTENMNTAPLDEVTMAVINRIDVLRGSKQDDIDDAEHDMELLDKAYEEADSADDEVRRLKNACLT